MPQPPENLLLALQSKAFNSRFFIVAVLLHLILIFGFGGTVLYHRISEPQDFTGDDSGGFVSADTAPAAPPPDTALENQPSMTVPTAPDTAAITAITAINAPAQPTFQMPAIAAPVLPPAAMDKAAAPAPAEVSETALNATQAKEIFAFTSGWTKKGSGGVGASPKNREFEFTAYLAKYGNPSDPKRGGDWASCNWISRDAGKEVIYGGSLPNLLYLINKLSRDKIHAEPQPTPLDLSSQEIFAKKPPFIFFTGHQDFVLTDQELENLQKYIRMGGCIWGDSSLPGRRSRFDLAFRREMRRVIPDVDKDWEQLPANHPLFAGNIYYPEINKPPPGINFYQEPVYALKYAGEVAVIYTANDYGDMWQIGLTDKLQPDFSRDAKRRLVAMNQQIWNARAIYFRGVDEKSVFNAYKFGTNVIIYLLTRWEDRLKTVPSGL